MNIRYKYGEKLDREKYKKDIEEFQAWTRAAIKMFNIADWGFIVHFEARKEGEDLAEAFKVQGETEADARYKAAVITYYLESVVEKNETEDERIEVVVHEVLHCVLSHLSTVITSIAPESAMDSLDYCEDVAVTHLSMLPFWPNLLKTFM